MVIGQVKRSSLLREVEGKKTERKTTQVMKEGKRE
jgi:hypothetical protein